MSAGDMKLFRLGKDVPIPHQDRRQKRSWLGQPLIPKGTYFTLHENFVEKPGNKPMFEIRVDTRHDASDGSGVGEVSETLDVHWTTGNNPKYPGENFSIGWALMENAEQVKDGYRARFMAAVGRDPYGRFEARAVANLLERLWDARFVSERQLRNVADGPPCPHRSDTGFPCALWEGHPPALSASGMQFDESGCDFSE